MKFIFGLAFLLSSACMFAQNIAPIGSVWYYRTPGPADNPILDGIQRLEATKDSIIDGLPYRVIACEQLRKGLNPQHLTSYYFHDSAGYVTFWYDGQVYPYFNFNAQQGDTVQTSLNEIPGTSITSIRTRVDSVYTDQDGLKTFVFDFLEVKQQLFQADYNFSFLEAFRPYGSLHGYKTLSCFTTQTISVKRVAGPCDSIPYHSFNNQIQYYYSMWKPHAATAAPFYRLIREQGSSSDQFWLRYHDLNNVHKSNGDVLFKEDIGARKLYVWKDAWYLLYDFSAQKGDTITAMAITNPLYVVNKAVGYESIQQFRYIIDSIYEEDSKLVQIPRVIPGEQWTIPGKIREGMGSDIALLGWPTQYDSVGAEGYLRCFFNATWGIYYFNPLMNVQTCYSVLTGLNDEVKLSNRELSLAPNPASVTLEIQNYPSGAEVKVYDMKGRCVGVFNQSTISVSQWSSGVYHVVLFDGEHYSTGKFMVQP